MADIVANLSKRFRIKEVSLDNSVFKLFSVGTVTLCLLGSLLCAATTYFGAPITCEFDDSVGADLAKEHCWIHGTNWIRQEYREEFDCIVSQSSNETDVPNTSYYQWVVFFLLVQAGLFVLPYKIWKTSEKGVIQGFTSADVRSAFLLADEPKTKELVKKYVKQFNCILHHNDRYFLYFVICELLNVLSLYLSFYATDTFLNGHFTSYGFDVLQYYRTDPDLRTISPMCEVFPTKVSCSLKLVAAGGGVSQKNGFCILSQNIVNEKIFLILFFWHIVLFVVSGVFVVYRICTIALPQFRRRLLCTKIRGKSMETAVQRVLAKCSMGDWFVLNQIGKNVNPYFFREFLDSLQHQIGKSKDKESSVCLMKYENDKDGEMTTSA